MKKIVSVLLVFCVACACVLSYAEGIDLTVMTKEELESLRERINEEIKSDHALTSSEQSRLDDTAKAFVEELFRQNDMTVSWAWFDYDYTRDWGYATMSTHFDAKDVNKKTTRFEVTVGAYLQNDEWTVIYLMLNDEVLYDLRSQIPDPRLNPEADEAAAIITPEPTPSPTPIPIELPTNTPTPEPTATPTPEPTPTFTPVPTPEPTAVQKSSEIDFEDDDEEPVYETLEPGSKGQAVTKLQNQLIYLRLLDGKADGSYGKKTENAVKAFQELVDGLEVNGIADSATQEEIEYQAPYDEDFKAGTKRPMPEPHEAVLYWGELMSIKEYGTNDSVEVRMLAALKPSHKADDVAKKCYTNVQDLVEQYGFGRYGELDFTMLASIENVEQPIVTFTIPHDALVLLARGDIASYDLGKYAELLWIHPILLI